MDQIVEGMRHMKNISREPTRVSCSGICWKKVNRTQRALLVVSAATWYMWSVMILPTSTHKQVTRTYQQEQIL